MTDLSRELRLAGDRLMRVVEEVAEEKIKSPYAQVRSRGDRLLELAREWDVLAARHFGSEK